MTHICLLFSGNARVQLGHVKAMQQSHSRHSLLHQTKCRMCLWEHTQHSCMPKRQHKPGEISHLLHLEHDRAQRFEQIFCRGPISRGQVGNLGCKPCHVVPVMQSVDIVVAILVFSGNQCDEAACCLCHPVSFTVFVSPNALRTVSCAVFKGLWCGIFSCRRLNFFLTFGPSSCHLNDIIFVYYLFFH